MWEGKSEKTFETTLREFLRATHPSVEEAIRPHEGDRGVLDHEFQA